jgi:hypothetical protein
MSLTALLLPTFTQMLTALSGWLTKAQAQMPQPASEALLSARLAPDMFPLSTQIRFSCVQAYEAAYRFRGLNFPQSIDALLDEGRNGGETPGSMSDAFARIAETLAFLNALAPDALDMDPAAPMVHTLPSGMIFDLTAEQYARDWVLAQFYFHIITAYAILRKEQVDIGKIDYIPHMLPYLRTH